MKEGDIFDAFKAAQARGDMPTDLSSKELRELSAGVRSLSVFTSRGTNAVFVSKIKEVINAVTAGEMDEATARWTLMETLRSLGYTPEGGFPGDAGKVPPAVKGSLTDLSSRRRLDLIIRTQVDLMRGAGMQMNGMSPSKLANFPCWELVRIYPVRVPRDWPERWATVGGTMYEGRMIAPKGDAIWGELGSNFDDSLDVDYPPFAFNSGMGWRDVTAAEADRLKVTSSDGKPWEEFLRDVERPRVIAGELPLPAPRLSLRGVFTSIRKWFQKLTGAVMVEDTATTPESADALRKQLADRAAARAARKDERMRRALER
jgi:hypothetical protein